MSKFIGYTVGLLASHKNFKAPKLVKVEFSRIDDSEVKISAVSGHNLGAIHKCGIAFVSQEEFSNRPDHNIDEAKWAFEKLGLSI